MVWLSIISLGSNARIGQRGPSTLPSPQWRSRNLITPEERSAVLGSDLLQAIGGASRDPPGSRATLTLLDRVIVANYIGSGNSRQLPFNPVWKCGERRGWNYAFILKVMHNDRCDVRGLPVETVEKIHDFWDDLIWRFFHEPVSRFADHDSFNMLCSRPHR
jgi:hypothetical protein